MERRLAAILAAHVVGYSHLIRKDEAGTLATLVIDARFHALVARTGTHGAVDDRPVLRQLHVRSGVFRRWLCR